LREKLRQNRSVPTRPAESSIRRFLSRVREFAAHLVGRESAWERIAMPVPAEAFGPGSLQPFAEYFEDESGVRVGSLDDIVAWLSTCEYVSDIELFHEPDVWQLPGAFETRRRGDCEDFALWAWRKLAEVGIDAEFYVGRVICDDHPEIDRQHAWVVYRVNGTDFLFEPAARTPSSMIRPLADAMDDYVPHFAVDHRFDTSAFAGCASDVRRASLRGAESTRPT
jgi:hypothetical protein